MKNEKIMSKDFMRVFIMALMVNLTFFFLNATMPLYSRILTGVSDYVGAMSGAYTIGALISRPFGGMLVPRWGNRKSCAIGLAGVCICFLVYPFCMAIYPLIGIRFVHGFAFGIYSTAFGAVMAEVLPESKLVQGVSYFNLTSTIASALGPGIALYIVGAEYTRFKPLFVISLVLSVIGLLSAATIRIEKDGFLLKKSSSKPEKAAAEDLIKKEETASEEIEKPRTFCGIETSLFIPSVTNFFANIAQTAVMSFLAIFAADNNIENVGLFFTISAISVFSTKFLVNGIIDKKGTKVVIYPAFIVYTLCFIAIALTRKALPLFIIGAVYGACQGAIFPTVNALFFQVSAPNHRAMASSMYYTSLDVGLAIGAFGLNAIALALNENYTYIYFVGAATVILTFLSYMVCVRAAKKRGITV